MHDYEVLSSDIVYEGRVIDLRRDIVAMPGGTTSQRDVVVHPGAGHATGAKEETTIAANTLELIQEPLDGRWLERARRSHSAEPLCEAVYRQARLAPATWEGLQAHPQFR